MYTLLSGLYHHLTQKEEYNVLIIGLDNAGKTVRWPDEAYYLFFMVLAVLTSLLVCVVSCFYFTQ